MRIGLAFEHLDDLLLGTAVDENNEPETESLLVVGIEPAELGELVISLLGAGQGGEPCGVFADSRVGIDGGHPLLLRERLEQPIGMGDHDPLIGVGTPCHQPPSQGCRSLEQGLNFHGRNCRSRGR